MSIRAELRKLQNAVAKQFPAPAANRPRWKPKMSETERQEWQHGMHQAGFNTWDFTMHYFMEPAERPDGLSPDALEACRELKADLQEGMRAGTMRGVEIERHFKELGGTCHGLDSEERKLLDKLDQMTPEEVAALTDAEFLALADESRDCVSFQPVSE